MEYRQLPHGGPNETFSVLGLGMGGIQVSPPEEIEAVVRTAIDNGINFLTSAPEAGASMSPLAGPSRGGGNRCSSSSTSGRCTTPRGTTAGPGI